jgi:hypothetical protein
MIVALDFRGAQLSVREECCKHCMKPLEESSGRGIKVGFHLIL